MVISPSDSALVLRIFFRLVGELGGVGRGLCDEKRSGGEIPRNDLRGEEDWEAIGMTVKVRRI